MNRIEKAFSSGKLFIPFIIGGDPDMETTEKLLYALNEAGADIIGIGIPFSDPVAEGPVIEAAHERALKSGCTVEKLFALVSRVRTEIKSPILFMTYYNSVFAYGVPRFTSQCSNSGIDGLIVPDLPFREREELLQPCVSNGLSLISLVSPALEARIANIAENSHGFIYCISSLGVTGDDLSNDNRRMVEQIKQAKDIPCAADFGVSTPEQAREIAEFVDGVIIGSAIVNIIAEHEQNSVEPVAKFAKDMKAAITNS